MNTTTRSNISSLSLLSPHLHPPISTVDVVVIIITTILSSVCLSASTLVCLVIYIDPLHQLRSPFSPYVFNLNLSGVLVGTI